METEAAAVYERASLIKELNPINPATGPSTQPCIPDKVANKKPASAFSGRTKRCANLVFIRGSNGRRDLVLTGLK